MSLIQILKQDQVTARKERKTFLATALTTLIGEAEMVGKNDGNRESTDAEVIRTVKKFVSNLEEAAKAIMKGRTKIELSPDDLARVHLIEAETELYAKYLPKQLTEDQLRQEVQEIKVQLNAGPKDMGKVMGQLKAKFDGQYDGKLASAIVKEVLA